MNYKELMKKGFPLPKKLRLTWENNRAFRVNEGAVETRTDNHDWTYLLSCAELAQLLNAMPAPRWTWTGGRPHRYSADEITAVTIDIKLEHVGILRDK